MLDNVMQNMLAHEIETNGHVPLRFYLLKDGVGMVCTPRMSEVEKGAWMRDFKSCLMTFNPDTVYYWSEIYIASTQSDQTDLKSDNLLNPSGINVVVMHKVSRNGDSRAYIASVDREKGVVKLGDFEEIDPSIVNALIAMGLGVMIS